MVVVVVPDLIVPGIFTTHHGVTNMVLIQMVVIRVVDLATALVVKVV